MSNYSEFKGSEESDSALVVFSGGQDSTTCLFWALERFNKVEAIFFNYGQRHSREHAAALKICTLALVELKVMNLSFFKEFSGSSLTDSSLDLNTDREGTNLPSTFVPGRNLIFLTVAASYAYTKNTFNIVTGVCQTDYSGYPDCRLKTIEALEKALDLGLETKLKLHTPLMELTKAQTVKLGIEVNAMEALKYSHTCYEGLNPPCGRCSACILRAKGFQEAGVKDPIFA